MSQEVTPKEYFNQLKEKKERMTDKRLQALYDNAMTLANKYSRTSQLKALDKLIFHIEALERERKVLSKGIDTFIYLDDVEEYIEKVADQVVKIIELENYEREIPEEIIDALDKVKDDFDQFYVVFTDYTGEMERKVEEKRKEKDPILFGSFIDKEKNSLVTRFYYIGDWIDEHCDLTLEKMISELKNYDETRDFEKKISFPKNLDELKAQANNYSEKKGKFVQLKTKSEDNFITKVKTFLSNIGNN